MSGGGPFRCGTRQLKALPHLIKMANYSFRPTLLRHNAPTDLLSIRRAERRRAFEKKFVVLGSQGRILSRSGSCQQVDKWPRSFHDLLVSFPLFSAQVELVGGRGEGEDVIGTVQGVEGKRIPDEMSTSLQAAAAIADIKRDRKLTRVNTRRGIAFLLSEALQTGEQRWPMLTLRDF